MNDLKVQEVFDFIDQRLIITENEDDYVLSSDIHYFLNKDKDYRDVISYRVINRAMRQIPHKIKKEKQTECQFKMNSKLKLYRLEII
jgi:hypothetical protein